MTKVVFLNQNEHLTIVLTIIPVLGLQQVNEKLSGKTKTPRVSLNVVGESLLTPTYVSLCV